jgi:putative spermidine/putrescine transport system permease protein
MRIGRFEAFLLLGGPVLFLVVFFVGPFLLMTVSSLQAKGGAWTAAQYVKVATDGYYWEILYETFKIGLWVALVTFVMGYALAYYITFQVKSRLVRRVIYIVVVTPLFTSVIVRSFAWIVMLGRQGLVNQALQATGIVSSPISLVYSKTGVIMGLSYVLLPFMVLTVSSILQNLNRSLLEAARDLGASPLMAFLKVTFPLSLPGVIAGSLMVFTLTVSAYVTPSVMSGGRFNVMSMLIFQQYMVLFDYNFGAALAIVLMVATLGLMGAYVMLLERRARAAG